MTTTHEEDYRRRVSDMGATYFLPKSAIEIVRNTWPQDPPKYALFDFDGTLSLIREGWANVMVPWMVEILQRTRTDETPHELSRLVNTFVMKLTGKQTILQMNRLVEEIQKRGGTAEDASQYKHCYHERLMERIHGRREALRRGEAPRDEMLVPCARQALQALRERGVELYLASGTDQHYVSEEVELLGLTDFFGSHIYGAQDDYTSFSKRMVIDRILSDNKVNGSRLIGFGDGFVEIDDVKSVGGIAVAVASDEAGRSGIPDPWKRERLIGIGADVVIPDFQDIETLLDYIWG